MRKDKIDFNLVKYYYQQGVFDKKKMCELVNNNTITAKEFKEITGLIFWVAYQEVIGNTKNLYAVIERDRYNK